jgi:hypothetical protein
MYNNELVSCIQPSSLPYRNTRLTLLTLTLYLHFLYFQADTPSEGPPYPFPPVRSCLVLSCLLFQPTFIPTPCLVVLATLQLPMQSVREKHRRHIFSITLFCLFLLLFSVLVDSLYDPRSAFCFRFFFFLHLHNHSTHSLFNLRHFDKHSRFYTLPRSIIASPFKPLHAGT